jgi:hypothetical protein
MSWKDEPENGHCCGAELIVAARQNAGKYDTLFYAPDPYASRMWRSEDRVDHDS